MSPGSASPSIPRMTGSGTASPPNRSAATRRRAWAEQQLRLIARASRPLGLGTHASFSGALLYPYPQWPEGLVEEGFAELAARCRPILDDFDAHGVDLCYEIYPREDLHDGHSWEMCLARVCHPPRACLIYDPGHVVLQALDYVAFIDHCHDRIRAFHVKDAEFRRLWRLPALGKARGPVPQPQRRPGRFRRHLHPAGNPWVSRLGSAGMGILPEDPRGRGQRRRALHRGAHHPRLGRFREIRRRPRRQSGHAQPGVSPMSHRRPLRLGMIGGGEGPISALSTCWPCGSTGTGC